MADTIQIETNKEDEKKRKRREYMRKYRDEIESNVQRERKLRRDRNYKKLINSSMSIDERMRLNNRVRELRCNETEEVYIKRLDKDKERKQRRISKLSFFELRRKRIRDKEQNKQRHHGCNETKKYTKVEFKKIITERRRERKRFEKEQEKRFNIMKERHGFYTDFDKWQEDLGLEPSLTIKWNLYYDFIKHPRTLEMDEVCIVNSMRESEMKISDEKTKCHCRDKVLRTRDEILKMEDRTHAKAFNISLFPCLGEYGVRYFEFKRSVPIGYKFQIENPFRGIYYNPYDFMFCYKTKEVVKRDMLKRDFIRIC